MHKYSTEKGSCTWRAAWINLPDAVLTDKTRDVFYRTHVHRARLPFFTMRDYHYECNATKLYDAVIGNMARLVNRGLTHLVDVITGDANLARKKLSKNQLIARPEFSAMHLAMEGIVKCFHEAHGCAASKRSALESSLDYGAATTLEHDDFYGVLDFNPCFPHL